MKRLGNTEVNTVTSYIGVHGGYLGEFTYATHASFYPDFCGLDIDPYQYEGTTRIRFIEILKNATPHDQAKILLGVLEKYPLHYFENQLSEGYIKQYDYDVKVRNHKKITHWIDELRGVVLVEELKHDFEFVRELLDQCDTLISNHSYGSAVDRAHTALHAYLKEVCKDSNLDVEEANPKIQDLWSKIKSDHPNFRINIKEYYKPINQIVSALSKLLENLNEIRNNQSFSHPNGEIIDEVEARLVINLSRVYLQYIDSKVIG